MARINLDEEVTGNSVTIKDEKAHYLVNVLRCREGDEITIFDRLGKCYRAAIAKYDRKEVTADIYERFACIPESPLHLTLVQGLLKGDKMDLVVQKTTELGVNEIVPVVSERSQLRRTEKTARWRKIAGEASRQCGRSIIPAVHDLKSFGDILSVYNAQSIMHRLLFYEETGMRLGEAVEEIRRENLVVAESDPDVAAPREVNVIAAVGPEGGFSKEEVQMAEQKGFRIISLGHRILRAETAAISVVTLLQFLLGDM